MRCSRRLACTTTAGVSLTLVCRQLQQLNRSLSWHVVCRQCGAGHCLRKAPSSQRARHHRPRQGPVLLQLGWSVLHHADTACTAQETVTSSARAQKHDGLCEHTHSSAQGCSLGHEQGGLRGSAGVSWQSSGAWLVLSWHGQQCAAWAPPAAKSMRHGSWGQDWL